MCFMIKPIKESQTLPSMKTLTMTLVFLTSITSFISAEISNSMMQALQNKAPEKLEIKVMKVSEEKSVLGNYNQLHFEVEAKVIGVERTHTGLKVGDRLLIQYKKYDDDKPVPSGSYPITVKEGQMYKAYLGMKKEDENTVEAKGPVVYSPQAARGSFVLLPDLNQNAEKDE